MNRRQILSVLVAGLMLPMATVAAKEPAEDWVDWLEDAGYSDIMLSRTMLGRVQIQARLGELKREIVLNPRTGEVLRDVTTDASGALRSPNGPSGDNRGGGDDHGGDDDHSDDSGGDDHGGGHGGGHGSDD